MAGRKKAKSSKAGIAAILISVLALLSVVALVIGLFSDWYQDFSKFRLAGNKLPSEAETMYAPGKDMLINQTSANGIMLLSAEMPLEDFATYALDGNVEAVKTITAHFTPADTTLQKVDYTADWAGTGAGYWSNDKDINDYITLTQSSDGSLDCAVSLKDAIGTQIIITCTARPLEEGDEVPSATCTVDYYKRHYTCDVRFLGNVVVHDPEEGDYNKGGYSYAIGEILMNGEIRNGTPVKYIDEVAQGYDDDYAPATGENTVTVTGRDSVGTVRDGINNSTINITVSISDSVASRIKSAAGVTTLKSYTLVTNGKSTGLKMKTAIDSILGGASNVSSHKNALYTAFKDIYDKGQTALTFKVTYTTEQAKFEYTFNKESLFNPLALGVKATDIGLDKPGIIF